MRKVLSLSIAAMIGGLAWADEAHGLPTPVNAKKVRCYGNPIAINYNYYLNGIIKKMVFPKILQEEHSLFPVIPRMADTSTDIAKAFIAAVSGTMRRLYLESGFVAANFDNRVKHVERPFDPLDKFA